MPTPSPSRTPEPSVVPTIDFAGAWDTVKAWDWVPILALIIATATAIGAVVRWVKDRPRLVPYAGRQRHMNTEHLPMGAGDSFALTVVNKGRRPGQLTAYGITLPDGREVDIHEGHVPNETFEAFAEKTFYVDVDNIRRMNGGAMSDEINEGAAWWIAQAGKKRKIRTRPGLNW